MHGTRPRHQNVSWRSPSFTNPSKKLHTTNEDITCYPSFLLVLCYECVIIKGISIDLSGLAKQIDFFISTNIMKSRLCGTLSTGNGAELGTTPGWDITIWNGIGYFRTHNSWRVFHRARCKISRNSRWIRFWTCNHGWHYCWDSRLFLDWKPTTEVGSLIAMVLEISNLKDSVTRKQSRGYWQTLTKSTWRRRERCKIQVGKHFEGRKITFNNHPGQREKKPLLILEGGDLVPRGFVVISHVTKIVEGLG